MPKTRHIIPLISFVLTLACLTPALAPSVVFPSRSAAPGMPQTSVEMIVDVDEGLYIRTGAGETFPLVDGENVLHDGEVVSCYVFEVKGESIWCKHEKGYSNARWMVGYNTDKEK